MLGIGNGADESHDGAPLVRVRQVFCARIQVERLAVHLAVLQHDGIAAQEMHRDCRLRFECGNGIYLTTRQGFSTAELAGRGRDLAGLSDGGAGMLTSVTSSSFNPALRSMVTR